MAMQRLRRWVGFRYLTLLLLAGSPGLGGVGLQVLHACTELMPWLAESSEASSGAHHDGGHGHEAPASQACHCLGHCQATAAPASLATAEVVRAQIAPSALPRLAGTSPVAISSRESHRLPPATAPPLI